MLFNSFAFIIFFVVVYLGWWLLPLRRGRMWLLLWSWVFYGWWDWRFLSLLLLTTTIDWGVGRLLASVRQEHRRPVLAMSVVANLGILAVFKYLGWFLEEASALLSALQIPLSLPALKIVLPVGLSFYTFQSLSYTIDVYRGQLQPRKEWTSFALFVAFFPQLVAGPIERADRLIHQLENPSRPTPAQLSTGFHLSLWGFFKKVFVADNLAVIVEGIFDTPVPPHGFLVLLGMYTFTWQIYGDFSGYTDIARGVARWMGVELMENFRFPLLATSPQDLWRRWHISLSTWLRDYLYIPLGGNRLGEARTRLNLMATMILGGLWHGANWTFVAWGTAHGLALSVHRLVPETWRRRIPTWLAVVATFHFTAITFLVFRSRDIHHAFALISSIATSLTPAPGDLALLGRITSIVTPLIVAEFFMWRRDDPELLLKLHPVFQLVITVALFLAVVVLGAAYGQKFIYFQF